MLSTIHLYTLYCVLYDLNLTVFMSSCSALYFSKLTMCILYCVLYDLSKLSVCILFMSSCSALYTLYTLYCVLYDLNLTVFTCLHVQHYTSLLFVLYDLSKLTVYTLTCLHIQHYTSLHSLHFYIIITSSK